MNPRVRPARPDDFDAVAAFTSDTFTWGDYVADAFDEWLEIDGSLVLVAVDETDTPLGLGRVLLLSEREAWLHAARIHPDHRRRGIGSLLNDALCAWAKEQGAQVARLMIESWNEAAQRQVDGLGYRRVTDWISATKAIGGDVDPTTNGGRRVPGDERLGPGSHAEIDPSWIAWSSSDSAAEGRRLYPIGWHMRQMTYQDVEDAAKRGALWYCPSGWVIGEAEERGLFVSWMVTSDLDVDRLLRAIVDRAERLDAERVRVMSPDLEWMHEALEKSGWDLMSMGIWATGL